MRVQHRSATAILALLLLAMGCQSPIKVSTDRDPEADFSQWQSYAWISPEPLIPQVAGRTQGPPVSPIEDRRIRDAVASQLAAKGWTRVESPDSADLIVSYGIGAEERTEIYSTPNSGGHLQHGYGYGGWYSGSTVRSKQILEGTLTLEFFERRTRQATWVGWASKRLSRSGSRDRGQEIQAAIEKILQEFPSTGAGSSL